MSCLWAPARPGAAAHPCAVDTCGELFDGCAPSSWAVEFENKSDVTVACVLTGRDPAWDTHTPLMKSTLAHGAVFWVARHDKRVFKYEGPRVYCSVFYRDADAQFWLLESDVDGDEVGDALYYEFKPDDVHAAIKEAQAKQSDKKATLEKKMSFALKASTPRQASFRQQASWQNLMSPTTTTHK